MSRTDFVLFVALIVGFLLFLYGANLTVWSGAALNTSESAIIGYSGIYLVVGSIAIYLMFYVYKELRKKPVSTAC